MKKVIGVIFLSIALLLVGFTSLAYLIDSTESLKNTFSAPATFTISYNANGGANAPDNQVKFESTDVVLSSDVPSRQCYSFSSWNTEADGSGVSYSSGDTYSVDADLSLYAQWSFVPAYAMLYDSNSDEVGDILVFQRGDVRREDEFGTFIASFTGFENAGSEDLILWEAYKPDILSVFMIDAIIPSSTANWFSDCSSLSLFSDDGNLITSTTSNMSYMFAGCSSLVSLDLSSISTVSVSDVSGMFSDCSSLATIYVDPDSWNMSSVSSSGGMFSGCSVLAGCRGTSFASVGVDDVSYACIDRPASGSPGYLSNGKPDCYSVSFEVGEGSGGPSPVDKFEDSPITIPLSEPVCDGKLFIGWSSYNESGVVNYIPGDTFDVDSNSVLYAVYTEDEPYVLLYDTDGDGVANFEVLQAGNISDSSLGSVVGSYVISLNSSTSWSGDESIEYAYADESFSVFLPKSIAGWFDGASTDYSYIDLSNVNLSLVAGSGWRDPSFPSVCVSYTDYQNMRKHIYVAEDPVYGDFTGWLFHSSTNIYYSPDVVGGDGFAMDGRYDQSYKKGKIDSADSDGYFTYGGSDAVIISYDYNYEGAEVPWFKNQVAPGSSFTVQGKNNNAPTPSRDGYVFLGWSEDPEADAATYTTGQVVSAERSITLYAVWSLQPTAMYYDTDGDGTADTIILQAGNVPDSDCGTYIRSAALSFTSKTSLKSGASDIRYVYTDPSFASYSFTDITGWFYDICYFSVIDLTYLDIASCATWGQTFGCTKRSLSASKEKRIFVSKNPNFGSYTGQILTYHANGNSGANITGGDGFIPDSSDERGVLYGKIDSADSDGYFTYGGSDAVVVSYDYNYEGATSIWFTNRVQPGSSFTVQGKNNNAPTPSRDGYVFLGWSEDPEADAATYTTGQVVSAERSMTLYAVWSVK